MPITDWFASLYRQSEVTIAMVLDRVRKNGEGVGDYVVVVADTTDEATRFFVDQLGDGPKSRSAILEQGGSAISNSRGPTDSVLPMWDFVPSSAPPTSLPDSPSANRASHGPDIRFFGVRSTPVAAGETRGSRHEVAGGGAQKSEAKWPCTILLQNRARPFSDPGMPGFVGAIPKAAVARVLRLMDAPFAGDAEKPLDDGLMRLLVAARGQIQCADVPASAPMVRGGSA